ncbi:MAG: hypothetical protein ACRC7O_06555 [Fimbriiglobus sp.]
MSDPLGDQHCPEGGSLVRLAIGFYCVAVLNGGFVLADIVWWQDGGSFLLGLNGVMWFGLSLLIVACELTGSDRRSRRVIGHVATVLAIALFVAVIHVLRRITG